MKIAIIDDEPKARKVLETIIGNQFPQFKIVGTAGNVNEGLELIRTSSPDLVFLDVQMPGGTGFDLLEKLPDRNFAVIFVTAFEQYAIDAFKFSAVDYILKPVTPDHLKDAVAKVTDLQNNSEFDERLNTLLVNLKKGSGEKKIVLKTSETIYIVAVSEIVRCQSDASYTRIFIRDGREVMVSKTLKEYEDLLTTYRFLRVHQSHLINLDFLREYSRRKDLVVLADESEVPVASRKKEILMKAIEAMK